MLAFLKRLIYGLSNKINSMGGTGLEEKITVDFSRAKKSPFLIKSESSYNANLSGGSLELGLKKTNCTAWIEIPQREYRDHIIETVIRLNSYGGYASTGILFHILDDDSYYIALVSDKGYFRVDLVKDGRPKTLIAWTEVADFNNNSINLKILTYGSYLIFLVNGKWIGEISDDSLSCGRIGFALTSYETAAIEEINSKAYVCKAYLDYFSADSNVKPVEDFYKKWTDDSNINAESRLRLAESFAAIGEAAKSLEQIKKAWKRRDEVIRSIATTYTEARTKKELLLAAKMAVRIGQFNEAYEFLSSVIEEWKDSTEGKEAINEKVKVLCELEKTAELKEFVLKYSDIIKKDIEYYTMLAAYFWRKNEFKDSACLWNKAFELNKENGAYAVNAAAALELAGKKEEALAKFLEAGKLFLKQDNHGELAAMMPKLSLLGNNNWEARTLAGKWAFSIENYDQCAKELAAANKLRCAVKPRPKADPAAFYLWGMVCSIKGKTGNAVRYLERAVKLAPNYGLFRFKLAEVKIRAGERDAKLAAELKKALKDMDNEAGKTLANYAGEMLQKNGYKKYAKYFFDLAQEKHAKD